ncbi:hypothetical protein [Deinococcus radiodurans]|jgi:hypothetical protein|uniref:Uncharacterized protein n=1 Tax=Deinococcus radiodurans (strain ATCC 13939 / DSM 20539 / JCM 16871 / CCUG 27074 / LMG 4051 / NBRC 15346 / NCIMB 9279 / VKM B-1422 / R1) TaxID=243230 RepID=Q9RWZ7_DEIRA|nr:hypothetical protein [Deinococcus radiodurans]AAF10098.1 hypothetical protein DR_0518 [Deinococcus radiodurans R1 = ATCC 13939 = DSM 20539]ANC72238.1 hypothetical protein A2G07_10925 [Deinococcus radiodurans R1 = ATCC 13939 = DSM 20539]QEM72467.1 hypothetical protein DXG80_12275 [Deinococcus radiodurans]QIP28696.1 hypothetical protein HAV23_05485 [Deinococcus radiodurans]QIP32601.1 hypothetical protein HAV35_11325 [Deinococcus radiodurans]
MPELTAYTVTAPGVKSYTTRAPSPALAVLPAARALYGRRARYVITAQGQPVSGGPFVFALGVEGNPARLGVTVSEAPSRPPSEASA